MRLVSGYRYNSFADIQELGIVKKCYKNLGVICLSY